MSLALKVLVVVIALIELAFIFIGDSSDQRLYRGVHLLQMVSLIAIVVVTAPPSRAQWVVILALAGSFFGDVANSNLIDLSAIYSPQVLLSIPLFFVTHFLYVGVFWRLSGSQLMPRVLVALLATAGLLQIIDPQVGLLEMSALAIYGVILLTMALMSFSFLGRALPGPLVTLGACVFVISDCVIAATLFMDLERTMTIDSVIWLSYIYAQVAVSCVLLLPPRESLATEEPSS